MSQQSSMAETRGHSLIWEQKWDEALKEFEVALQENPDNPTIHDGIATAKRELGDIKGALIHFEKAAELTDQNTIYLRQVADLQQKMGDLKDAAETFMKIGEKHLSDKRLSDAVDNWVLATRFNSDHLKAHERLAKVYENQERPWLAVNEFLEVARIYENQGQLNRALRACERALKIDPRNAEALTAAELLKTGDQAFPQNSRIHSDQPASGSRLTGNYRSAQIEIPVATPVADRLQKAREQMAEDIFSADVVGQDNDVNLMALISQGLTDQTQGDYPAATSSFVEVLNHGLRTPAVIYTLSQLYQMQSQFADAIPLLNELIDETDYEFVRLYGLGECLRGLGHIDKAVEYYIDALISVDLPTVSPVKHDRLKTQYAELLESLSAEAAVDQATSFALAFGRFLQTDNWDETLKDSRRRLDSISAEPGSMIMGDMLNAGSSRILESLQLSQEYAEQGLYDSAIEEVYRAIEVSAGYLPAHIQMADLLAAKNKHSQASQKLQTIGRTYMVRGDKEGAIGVLQKAAAIAPLNSESQQTLLDLLTESGRQEDIIGQYLIMGNTAYQQAQLEDARKHYIEGLKMAQETEISPGLKGNLLQHLGDLEMQLLDWKKALPIWLELTRLEPENTSFVKKSVKALYNLNEKGKGLKLLDQQIVKLIKAKQGRSVFKLLEELDTEYPNDPGLVERLSRLYARTNQKDKAISLLDKLGEALLNVGNHRLAEKTIQKILSLDPPNKEAYEQLLVQLKSL